ncbi:MAG: hypothetical protein K6L80_10935 [Agarilytica sp.]
MKIYDELGNAKDQALLDILMTDPDLESDGPWGIIEKFKGEYPRLNCLISISDPGECIKKIDRSIPNKSLLFLSASSGNDDLIFKLESDENIEKYTRLYGYQYMSNLVPVRMLPNLWSTPGQKLDEAIYKYANRQRSPSLTEAIAKTESYLLNHLWLFLTLVVALLLIVVKYGL